MKNGNAWVENVLTEILKNKSYTKASWQSNQIQRYYFQESTVQHPLEQTY